MADQTIIGSINDIQGSGSVAIIVRSSGESINARLGGVIFSGDTIITSNDTSVIITLNKDNSQNIAGFVRIGNDQIATFNDLLFERVIELLPNSLPTHSINVGIKSSVALLEQFNKETESSVIDAIQAANQDSQSQVVIDENTNVEALFGAPSAGSSGVEPSVNNASAITNIIYVAREFSEASLETIRDTTNVLTTDTLNVASSSTTNFPSTGTINLPPPSIASVVNDSSTEGDNIVYTVTLSNIFTAKSTFSFSLDVNTAASKDFISSPTFSNGVTLNGGNITVPAGVTTR